eukprot:SAG22_NODE_679_length_7944_cov_2.240408_3_plen_130_part_00
MLRAAGLAAMGVALASAQRADPSSSCAPSSFLAGVQMYCPADHASCPSACSHYLTQKLAACPGISAGLSSADQRFMRDACHKTDAAAPAADGGAGQGFYALSAIDIEGNLQEFSSYMGKVSLVVNVAQF